MYAFMREVVHGDERSWYTVGDSGVVLDVQERVVSKRWHALARQADT
jgi:hypothetical protein